MQSTIKHIEDFVTKAGDLAETKAELLKLRSARKIAETISSLISLIAIVTLIAVAFTIVSVGFAFWLGTKMNNIGYGFFIVGGFYFLVGIIIYYSRNQWIKKPLTDLLIDKIIK